jgi:hypothetical protein
MTKLLLIFPILFEAISEGLYLRGTTLMKVISKQIQVLLIASWFIILYFLTWSWELPVIYILLRVIVFNYVHNLSAGLPLNYLGTVSFIDRIVALACGKAWWMILIAQGIALVAVYYLIQGIL